MDGGIGLLERWLEKRPMGAPDNAGTLRPGAVVGEWRVEVFIGAGLTAEVYRVTNIRMRCEGALKLLIDESRGLKQRFIDEADAMRCLALASLPRFLDSGEYGGSLYYVMEYLEPVEIFDCSRAAAKWMMKVALAVHSLHCAGYIHRDLKPGNIMRRRNGEVVIIDLGLIKKCGIGGSGIIIHQCRAISIVDGRPVGVGTLDYAAPEQLLKGEYSIQSDIFALGKLLKFYCNGRVPRNLRMTFRRATRDAPSDRFPSAKAFASSIRHRYRSTIIFSAVIAAIVITAGLYPVWKPPLADYLRPLLNPPEKVLGVISQKENENDVDYFNRIKPLAEKGNVEAEIALAEAYFYGRGVTENRQEAVKWYAKAAEAGDPSAQASLGLCLFRGWGCAKDHSMAAGWFTKAAEAGDLSAMNGLAYSYLHGFGVEKDVLAGFNWALKAAERGHHPSQTMVAECYLDGIGVEKNIERAETWLYRAARLGNKRAQMLLRTR